MIFIAASISFAFKSFILASAISCSCFLETEPTTSRLGVFAPDFNFAAFLRNYEAGEVLISIVKDLSA